MVVRLAPHGFARRTASNMLPLCAISSSNKRRNGAPPSRWNRSWMSRAQKVSAHTSMAAPGGSGARRNAGSPPCSIRRRRSVTPNSLRSYIVAGVSQTVAMCPARVVGGGQGPADALLGAASIGSVDRVRIRTPENRLAASSTSSRAFSSRPIWSRTMVCPGTPSGTPQGAPEVRATPGAEQSKKVALAAAWRANSVLPAPRTPTTETTECRFQASSTRICQYLRGATQS